MGAVGGGEHGPAFLSETKKKPQPSTSSVPGQLFHPSIPAGAGTQEQATGSPPLPESLWVTLPPQRVPTAPQHRWGGSDGCLLRGPIVPGVAGLCVGARGDAHRL